MCYAFEKIITNDVCTIENKSRTRDLTVPKVVFIIVVNIQVIYPAIIELLGAPNLVVHIYPCFFFFGSSYR
jgi:hypothetical protein